MSTMSTLWTRWGTDTVRVTADWGNASCQITGDLDGGYQVADCRHAPKYALRRALEQAAAHEGMTGTDRDRAIAKSMAAAQETSFPSDDDDDE